MNPKLDLLVPGINSLDLLIKHDSSNNKKYISTSSRDYFWGKKTTNKKNDKKKNAVCPLPPVHSKTNTETEPLQVGWAGQQIRKPQTDPRPELSKPECKLGPSKDPKKKKPPKKKSKKNKYLVCGKVKERKENVKDAEQTTKDNSKNSKDIMNDKENKDSDLKDKRKQLKSQPSTNEVSKTPLKGNKDSQKECTESKNVVKKKSDLKINQSKALVVPTQKTKESSKDSKAITYNEENCYSDSKEYKKELNSDNSINDVSKSPLKSVVKEEILLENLIKESGNPQTDKRSVFKIICNKLVLNEVNVKEPTIRESISNPPNKINVCAPKACTSLNKNEKDNVKHESVFKSNQPKALVCKEYGPSSLIPTDESKTTNRYLCKENKEKSKHLNKLGKTESVCSKNICLPRAASANEIKAPINNTKKEKDGDETNNINTCFKKTNVDDCSESKSVKDSNIDKIKFECKKAITKRPTTSPIEKSDNSKAKESKISSNTESGCNKSATSPYNFMQRPQTAYFKKHSSKSGPSITSGQPKTDCNSNKQNSIDVNKKSDQGNEDLCECTSAEKSKVREKRNETNDSEKLKSLEHSTSKCLNIDPKLTEKLQCIAQEELFKKADSSSTDLTKCSSYMGFKVKQSGSKLKPATENSVEDHTNDRRKTPHKEVCGKQKGQSKTDMKTTTCDNDSIQPKKNYDSFRATKSESCLNEEATKQTLNNTSQDLNESKSQKVCDSDTKDNLRDGTNKLSKKKSSTKTKKSKKSKSKSSVEKSKSKKAGKKKKTTSNKEHDSEKSSRCTKYSDSAEYKDLKENIKYDKGKDEDKQECCKTTKKDMEKPSSEKIKNSSACQPSSDTKETTTDKKNIVKHESKESNENQKKNKPNDYLKHIITGAKQRKKAVICTKIKPFQSAKSKGKSNEVDKTKTKPSSSQKFLKNDESVERVKKVKSGKVCSEKKSSISIDTNSKKSKSKHSLTSKAGNLDRSKDTSKSQKGKSLTKLNKLVRKAKCSTASGIRKDGTLTNALICSKSTPNIQSVKQNKIAGLPKQNEAIKKERPALNSSDKNSRKGKSSKNETNSTKMCSLHTLQKRMPATPSKTSKRIDVKSFSELKTMNNIPQRDISAELFNSCNYPSQLSMLWNKKKIERTNLRDSGITEELKLGSTEHNIGRNCLKLLNCEKNELMIDPKIRKLSPYLKKSTNLQLVPISQTREGNKRKSKVVLKLGAKASKNGDVLTAANSHTKMATKSLNNVKAYSNNRLNPCDTKDKRQKNRISIIVSKDSTINVQKPRKINNQKKIMNNQNGGATHNKKELTNSNKTMEKGFQERNKVKGGSLASHVNKGVTKETCLKETYRKGEGSKIQPHKATVSKIKTNSKDSSNTDMKSANQTVRAMSAAATKRLNNALSVPPRTPSPWKSKSFSSFNALTDHDTVAKHTVWPSQSSKKEDFEIKTIDNKHSQNQESNIAEMLFHTNKISDQSLPFTKCENSSKSLENKISPFRDKNSFDHDRLGPGKLPNLQENKRKQMVERTDSLGQTNGRRTHDSNEIILCDFIEGSFDIDVQKIEPQYLDDDTKNIIKQYRRENTAKKFIMAGKNNFKYNNRTKKEPRKPTRSTLRNKTLVIDQLEQYVSKLENIVPSMNRIFKPIYLNSGVSVDENGESKNISAVKTPAKDKILDKIISKGADTENKAVKEINNIRQTRRNAVDESACDRKIINFHNTIVKPNNSETPKGEAAEKFSNNTLRSDLQNDETKNDTLLNREITNKTSLKSNNSPKLKNKIKLISKRHVKYTNYDYKSTPLTAADKDSGSDEKPEAKDTLKIHSDTSNESNNTAKLDKTTPVSIPTSLSSKQTRLLMEQPFFKIPKYEPPTSNAKDRSEPEPSLVAINRENANSISSPDQPAKELRLLIEQGLQKQSKSEPHTENLLCNSRSKNNIQDSNLFTENELHSLKTENDLDAPEKDQGSGISPRKQQSSIRSQLQRKIPIKAVVQQVKLKNTEKDQ